MVKKGIYGCEVAKENGNGCLGTTTNVPQKRKEEENMNGASLSICINSSFITSNAFSYSHVDIISPITSSPLSIVEDSSPTQAPSQMHHLTVKK